MRKITERTILLRGQVELPGSLNLVTEEFREGWNFVQSGDTHWMDREIRRYGWHFMWIGEGSLRSGVGQISQEAIASALKLALRRVSECFNAAEVESIKIKKYPWFVLAKVKVYPYQMQQSAVLSASGSATKLPLPSAAEALAIPVSQVAPAA
ncbi:MAG: hypothetical protein WBX22_07990 [Silvibacterium sp.]|jgi:hypothetical protein